MSITDPIADMFTCIRNSNAKFKDKVDIPLSKIKFEILNILKQEGFIQNYKKVEENSKTFIRIFLKYNNGEKVIKGLKRVSKPGLRIYKKSIDIPKVRAGLGLAIVSTCKGVLTDREARTQNVGGEIIGYIW